MCSIIGSFDIKKIKELVELNRYRGEFSHSITYLDPNFDNARCKVVHVDKGLGPIDVDKINPPNFIRQIYTIVHQQAPTGETTENCIHPARYGNNLLWHNGILKAETVNRLFIDHKEKFQWIGQLDMMHWDTYLMLLDLISFGRPNNIDGSFACLYHKEDHLYAFRNELVPLWMDNDFTFSSTKFKDSYRITPNQMLEIDLHLKRFRSLSMHSFTTVDNPFDELDD